MGIGSARNIHVERPLKYLEVLSLFAWPVCKYICSLRRKFGVLDEQRETNGLQLFADHHDDVFWRDSLTLLTMNRSFRIQVLDM